MQPKFSRAGCVASQCTRTSTDEQAEYGSSPAVGLFHSLVEASLVMLPVDPPFPAPGRKACGQGLDSSGIPLGVLACWLALEDAHSRSCVVQTSRWACSAPPLPDVDAWLP